MRPGGADVVHRPSGITLGRVERGAGVWHVFRGDGSRILGIEESRAAAVAQLRKERCHRPDRLLPDIEYSQLAEAWSRHVTPERWAWWAQVGSLFRTEAQCISGR